MSDEEQTVKHDMAGPADTRMMPIVHDALRRDLRRLRSALTTTPYPVGPRKAALTQHITWLMDFLHAHHASEDDGLYPMVRAKNPGAAALLDQMDSDHHAIDPAMSSLREAGENWASSDDDTARASVLSALDDLHSVLDPHLEREESEAMPVVSATITHREWHDWDQASNIKVKPLPRLAEEGNWLLDDLDPARAEIVKAEVPAIPRFIVMYGFGPGYRRRAHARWGAN